VSFEERRTIAKRGFELREGLSERWREAACRRDNIRPAGASWPLLFWPVLVIPRRFVPPGMDWKESVVSCSHVKNLSFWRRGAKRAKLRYLFEATG
jgi:hypothetical protein